MIPHLISDNYIYRHFPIKNDIFYLFSFNISFNIICNSWNDIISFDILHINNQEQIDAFYK